MIHQGVRLVGDLNGFASGGKTTLSKDIFKISVRSGKKGQMN